MNLPFLRQKKKIEAPQVTPMAPTKLVTNLSLEHDLVPPIPERYLTETLKECVLNGIFEGLYDVNFNLSVFLAEVDIKQKLLASDSYEIPEYVWHEIRKLNFRQLGWAIYIAMRFAHVRNALMMARSLESGTNGLEYQMLPPEMAGEEMFISDLELVKPFLKQLGLDKGQTQSEGNGVDYPEVFSIFQDNRTQFFRAFNLNEEKDLRHFIVRISDKLDYWPQELTEVFYDSFRLNSVLDWLEDERNYFSPRLHPQYYRNSDV